MSKFDLRTRGALDQLAPFKVLAVMCHPEDLARREAMMAAISKASGIGEVRRQPLGDDEFMRKVARSAKHAQLAGSLLLTRLQLFARGEKWSLNEAIPLVTPWLPKWEQPRGGNSVEKSLDHTPTSKPNILLANKRFLRVAHLWAALLHGQQHGNKNVWPGSNDTLPTFLACADFFLRKSEDLPSRGKQRATHPTRPSAWVFVIPESLRDSIDLAALPLDEIRNPPTTSTKRNLR